MCWPLTGILLLIVSFSTAAVTAFVVTRTWRKLGRAHTVYAVSLAASLAATLPAYLVISWWDLTHPAACAAARTGRPAPEPQG